MQEVREADRSYPALNISLGSTLVMVWKQCGAPRMCLDYQWLNAVTKDVAYPIPHTHDCLDTVAGATIFSTIDMTAAYH